MIYRVVLDGQDIHDEFQNNILIEPELNAELNAAGNFEATIPYYHKYYDLPELLTQDIDIYEDNSVIWFGRILDISLDMSMNKKIYCEGAYGYFNDSVQRPQEFESILLETFFRTLIDNHNAQVPANRRFTVGNYTMGSYSVYRKLDYETTIEALDDMCLNAEGGFFFFRKENGVQYIDWLSEMPYTTTQPIEYGLNLTDLKQSASGEEFYTAVLPLGQDLDGEKLTIASVNDGKDYIDSEAVATYGRILSVQDFSEITTAEELLAEGQKWLTNNQFDKITIECEAAELHYLDQTYGAFKMGQMVHVVTTPHLLEADFPIVKMNLKLDDCVKKISIGTLKRRELTEILKEGTVSTRRGGAPVSFDATPTSGSNRAVTSAGIYEVMAGLRFSINEDMTVHVERG